jgi:perosamine synthetase
MGDLSWRFDENEYNYIKEVLDSGFASGTSGNMNTRLEKAFAKKYNAKFAITANSGTTTLHAALWALGVRYGDEVIVTPLTVISCMNAILYCNAIPVFADIDPHTFNIDPDSIRKCITSKTKVIMPVHLYGQVCNMTEIMKIAKEHNLGVLEDCAQCYLGTHNGSYEGTFGDVASWSFENSKHLTTGDGGILICNDEKLGDNLRKLTCQGFRNATAISGKIRSSKDIFQNPNFKRHSQFGFMYRLPEVAAAIGLAQINKIDWFVKLRIQMADMYKKVLDECECDWIKPQKTPKGDINSSYAFAATLENKNVTWEDFRSKFIEFGGDGFYAAWTLCYQEDSIPDVKKLLKSIGLNERFNTNNGICPNAEKVQKKIMQFTTNQKNISEMKIQADALKKTILYFT